MFMAREEVRGAVGYLFTDTAKWFRDVPFKKKDNLKAYELFARKARNHGLKVFFAFHKEYRKGGVLRRCWEYDKGWKKVMNKGIDIVYGRFNAAAFRGNKKNNDVDKFKQMIIGDLSMINHPELEEFCWDKRIISEVFPEYCPKTFVVNTQSGLKTVLSDIRSDKVILKPRYGTLGKDVLLVSKEDIPKTIEKNTLVQEFIDTSKGIEGVAEGVHDLRMIIVNGKVDHAHIRLAKKGSFTANVSKGGTKRFVELEKIPASVFSIVKKVDKVLSHYYPRLYSVDFMFDEKGRPFIVECNSSPVIKRYAYGKYKQPEFFDRIFEAMKAGIRVKVTEEY